MFMGDLLHEENPLSQFPEQLVGLGRPELVTEQDDAGGRNEGLHGGDEMGDGVFEVDDVGGDDEVEVGAEGLQLLVVIPVEDGGLEVALEGGAVVLEVALEGGHDGGDVGEGDVGEAEEGEGHAGGTAAAAELDGALVGEMEEEGGVGVGGGGRRGLREEEPAFEEFGEDEGAGPDGGADVHGTVVLLDGKVRVRYLEFYHRRVREPHLSLSFFSPGKMNSLDLGHAASANSQGILGPNPHK